MMFELTSELSMRKQALCLNVPRTAVYYKPMMKDESEWANRIREVYLASEGRYGYRKVTAVLQSQDFKINHKRVFRIMQELHLQGLYPQARIQTSPSEASHPVYPYLLSD